MKRENGLEILKDKFLEKNNYNIFKYSEFIRINEQNFIAKKLNLFI